MARTGHAADCRIDGCPAPDTCQLAPTCDSASGACLYPDAPDTTTCDDGLFCTVNDHCVAGTCTGGAARDCSGAGNTCNDGVCDEAADACVPQPKPGTPICDDGNACTQSDHCSNGTCVGAEPVTCSASDQCHVAGTCNPSTGVCSNPTAPENATCNDGLFCTVGDRCVAGVCTPTGARDCSGAADACNDGICNEATDGCVAQPKPGTPTCDDGNACTQSDHCSNGTCVGANPVVCGTRDQCHVAGVCNPATGTCSNPVAPDTKTCDDGLFCTVNDHCVAGACTGGVARDCSVAGNACNDGICNETTNACVPQPKAGTPPCNDGNACTQSDHCSAGACVGTNPVICTATDQCHTAGVCNPASGTCSNPTAPDTTTCEDGLFCTVGDHCVAGTCTGGAARDCSVASNACNDGICNETANACLPQPKPGTPACDDGNACTQSDHCSAGTCIGTNPVICTATDQCHMAGVCNPASGACTNPTAPDTTTCEDGLFCTVGDHCVAGTCTAGAPRNCGVAGNACNDGICNEATNACVPQPKPGTPACDDGNGCTQSDHCSNGTCIGTNPVVCTASDQCHGAGTCNPSTGLCSNPNAPDDTPCEDGLFCTVNDRCVSGSCSAGASRDCTAAGNTCNDGVCNEATDKCVPQPKAGSPACDDGNACTQSDHCSNGACVGANPVVCAASDQCHVAGTCNPSTGACSNPTAPENTTCDDGAFCTVGDRCVSGTCTPSGPRDCTAAGNVCNDGVCNEATNACVPQPKAGSPACDDGNACTQSDHCSNGSCVGTNPVVCTASDQCHTAGTCNPTNGACSNPTAPENTTCDDGAFCTVGDRCVSGTCTPTGPRDCASAGDACNDGTCNEATRACVPHPKAGTPPCDDGNACTHTDKCVAGTCTGSDPVVCTPSDQCHVAGTCNPSTGACSNPNAPDLTGCDDRNVCTENDVCHGGICGGSHRSGCCVADVECGDAVACTADRCVDNACTHQPTDSLCATNACTRAVCSPSATGADPDGCLRLHLQGCCLNDAECADAVACTSDRCLANACVHEPVDARCGPGDDCSQNVCAPGASGADASGCRVEPRPDAVYCAEDRDPCTMDDCVAGTCVHDATGAPPDCSGLTKALADAIDLRARTATVGGVVTKASSADCAVVGSTTGCDVAGGGNGPATKLLASLAEARGDLDAAVNALGGRLSSADTAGQQTGALRASLALSLIATTPDDYRSFRATLQTGRKQKKISATFARARRAEGSALLRSLAKLRGELRRATRSHGSFQH